MEFLPCQPWMLLCMYNIHDWHKEIAATHASIHLKSSDLTSASNFCFHSITGSDDWTEITPLRYCAWATGTMPSAAPWAKDYPSWGEIPADWSTRGPEGKSVQVPWLSYCSVPLLTVISLPVVQQPESAVQSTSCSLVQLSAPMVTWIGPHSVSDPLVSMSLCI